MKLRLEVELGCRFEDIWRIPTHRITTIGHMAGCAAPQSLRKTAASLVCMHMSTLFGTAGSMNGAVEVHPLLSRPIGSRCGRSLDIHISNRRNCQWYHHTQPIAAEFRTSQDLIFLQYTASSSYSLISLKCQMFLARQTMKAVCWLQSRPDSFFPPLHPRPPPYHRFEGSSPHTSLLLQQLLGPP